MKGNGAITFFMMPFYLKKTFKGILPENCFWIRKNMTLEINTFYPYLQQFLTGTAHKSHDKNIVQPYDYYTFSYENDSIIYKALENHILFLDLNEGNGERSQIVRFKMGRDTKEKNTFFTPKLIVCPIAEVGILIFPIEVLMPTTSLKNLLDFNYILHHNYQDLTINISYEKEFDEINKQLCPYDSKGKLKNEVIREASFKKATTIWNGLCQEAEQLRTLFNNNGTDVDLKLDDSKLLCLEETSDALKINIKFGIIEELLMKGLDGWYERFNNKKYHLFTYIELENIDISQKLHDDFFHITTCTNNSYNILKSSFSDLCTQTFENVYIGSSVEGGAMMIIKPKPSTSFWNGFAKGQLDKRYLWFYIMALMQRHILIHHIYKLTKIYSGGKTSMKLLREEVSKASKLGVNTYFTELTDYTQHNIFYSHCRKNLNIDALKNEQTLKMKMLNDCLESKSDRIKEKQQWILALLVGILTIISATNDGMDIILRKFNDDTQAFYHLYKNDLLIQGLHWLYNLGGGVWSLYVLFFTIIMAPIVIGWKYYQYTKANH